MIKLLLSRVDGEEPRSLMSAPKLSSEPCRVIVMFGSKFGTNPWSLVEKDLKPVTFLSTPAPQSLPMNPSVLVPPFIELNAKA